MHKTLLHHSPIHGITEFFHPSDDGDSFTIETVQDVEPLLERNKADLNEASGRRWDDGKLVARIPCVIYNEWKRLGYMEDQEKLKSLLNDPENAFMRCWPGHL